MQADWVVSKYPFVEKVEGYLENEPGMQKENEFGNAVASHRYLADEVLQGEVKRIHLNAAR